MPRYRGDDIPPVSAYAHWGEEAEQVWYQENKYDMQNAGEPLDDDPYEWEEEEDEEEDDDRPSDDPDPDSVQLDSAEPGHLSDTDDIAEFDVYGDT